MVGDGMIPWATTAGAGMSRNGNEIGEALVASSGRRLGVGQTLERRAGFAVLGTPARPNRPPATSLEPTAQRLGGSRQFNLARAGYRRPPTGPSAWRYSSRARFISALRRR